MGDECRFAAKIVYSVMREVQSVRLCVRFSILLTLVTCTPNHFMNGQIFRNVVNGSCLLQECCQLALSVEVLR